jgi:hypothetical protein
MIIIFNMVFSFLKWLFSKRLLLLKQKLFRVDWSGLRDSCGSSGTGETHAGVYAEEAHRPPRGKRATGEEINPTPYYLVNSNKVCENSL